MGLLALRCCSTSSGRDPGAQDIHLLQACAYPSSGTRPEGETRELREFWLHVASVRAKGALDIASELRERPDAEGCVAKEDFVQFALRIGFTGDASLVFDHLDVEGRGLLRAPALRAQIKLADGGDSKLNRGYSRSSINKSARDKTARGEVKSSREGAARSARPPATEGRSRTTARKSEHSQEPEARPSTVSTAGNQQHGGAASPDRSPGRHMRSPGRSPRKVTKGRASVTKALEAGAEGASEQRNGGQAVAANAAAAEAPAAAAPATPAAAAVTPTAADAAAPAAVTFSPASAASPGNTDDAGAPVGRRRTKEASSERRKRSKTPSVAATAAESAAGRGRSCSPGRGSKESPLALRRVLTPPEDALNKESGRIGGPFKDVVGFPALEESFFCMLKTPPYNDLSWNDAEVPRTFLFHGELLTVPLLPIGSNSGESAKTASKAGRGTGWQKVRSSVMGGTLGAQMKQGEAIRAVAST